jgi:competence protein ComEA
MKGVNVMPNFKVLILTICLALASFGALAVDVNNADAATLAAELQGVGPAKAAAIVAYREANGPFKRLKDLTKVKGIGRQTIEKNRDRLLIDED